MGKLLNAVVKFPVNKIIQTQYGTRVNVVLTADGEEFTIWGEPDTPKGEQLKALQKGDRLLVLEDAGKYKLLESEPQNTSTNSNGNSNNQGTIAQGKKQNYEPLSDDKKREIVSYIQDQAAFYSYCRETSIKALSSRFDEQEISGDDIRSMTATLYISVQKRFGI